VKTHLIRRVQAQILSGEVEDLLDARAGVEHQGEECVVAHPGRRGPVDTLEQSVQFATVKVLDRCLPRAALKRYVEDTLELRHALRALHG
jgi:hypothetical protein